MDLEGTMLARLNYELHRAEMYKKALIDNNIELPDTKPLNDFLDDFESLTTD